MFHLKENQIFGGGWNMSFSLNLGHGVFVYMLGNTNREDACCKI